MLRRGGAARAVLITALLFALFHFSPWVFMPAFWFVTRSADARPPALERVPARLARPLAWICGIAGGGGLLLTAVAFVAMVMLMRVYTMPDEAKVITVVAVGAPPPNP